MKTLTKKCFKCGKRKRLAAFYTHPKMADGYLNKCKECTKRDVRLYRANNKAKIAARDKLRGQRPKRKAMKHRYRATYLSKNPDKYKARNAVGNALRAGKIQRLPCYYCGAPQTEAHHEDYGKPLDVRWVCLRCHRQHHHSILKGL